MDNRSYFEKERCLVFDCAGVVGRSIYIIDFEGFLNFSEVDLVPFCKVDVDTVDICTAVDKNSCLDVFSLSGVEHVGWYSKLF